MEIDESGGLLRPGRRCQIPFSVDGLLVDFITFHRLIRREVLESVGGIHVEFEECPDYDLCLRLSEVAGVAHLKRPLYRYRVHPSSVSQQRAVTQQATAARTVRAALARRGLQEHLRLVVSNEGVFSIEPLEPTEPDEP